MTNKSRATDWDEVTLNIHITKTSESNKTKLL